MRKIYACLPGIDGIVDLGYIEMPEEEKEQKDQNQAQELELPF